MSLGARTARHRDALAWLAVAAIAALSAWWRWRSLASSPDPVGVDGYYYALQLRSILDDGALAYPASPLAFWLMAPLAAATDPITGAKLGAALGGGLVAVPAYLLGRRLARARTGGLVAALVATGSAGSFYLSHEFVKQGLGVTVALLALWLVARALEHPTAARVIAAVAVAAAAAATHATAAALVVLAGAPAVAVEWAGRRPGRPPIAFAAVAVATIGVTGALAFLVASDLGLTSGLWSQPRWSLPALDTASGTLRMGGEPVLAGLVSVAALLVLGAPVMSARTQPWMLPRPADRALAAGMAVLGLLLALPWLDVGDPQGLGFRLRLLAYVPMALGIAIALGPVLPRLTTRRRGAVVAAALAWTLAQPRRSDEGIVRPHPAMVAAVEAMAGVVPDDGVVITTERPLVFMVTWYTGAPARLRPEPVPPARRWRLLPLAFIGRGSPLDDALTAARHQPGLVPPRGLHSGHPNGLVLLPEATWEWVLARLPPTPEAAYRAWHTL